MATLEAAKRQAKQARAQAGELKQMANMFRSLERIKEGLLKLETHDKRYGKHAKKSAAPKLKIVRGKEKKAPSRMGPPRNTEQVSESEYARFANATVRYGELVHSTDLKPVLTRTAADKVDDALNVIFELRKQPGIISPYSHSPCYMLEYHRDRGVHVSSRVKTFGCVLGPAFRTSKRAQEALEEVGLARIEKAFKTLLFVS